MEYRLQEHYVDDYETIPPPRAKRKRLQKHDLQAHLLDEGKEAGDKEANNGEGLAGDSEATKSIEDNNEESLETEENKKDEEEKKETPVDTKKMLVARPFVTMRGHTAFLTFATTGLLPQPDPNAETKEE
jgi:hypothetical protein